MAQIIDNNCGENIPKISVVMPLYKGDDYLSEAIDSILNQTFSDFEFLIICDDPTDKTRDILDKYRHNDSRMEIYYQERQGLVNSLNKGIYLAKGEYIARMDADDISLPNRFEKQVEFMDKNPEIGISGTWAKPFSKKFLRTWKRPCTHENIKAKLLFESAMVHPTVIIRKNIFSENNLCYRLDETYAEDYGLWVRAIKVLRFGNIPEVLLHYRLHESTSNKAIQKELTNNIRLSQIKQLGIDPSEDEFQTHQLLLFLDRVHKFKVNQDFSYQAKSWLEKLQKANSKTKIYPEPFFSNTLAGYWYYTCCNSMHPYLYSWNLFYSSELSKFANLSISQKVILLTAPNAKKIVKTKMIHGG